MVRAAWGGPPHRESMTQPELLQHRPFERASRPRLVEAPPRLSMRLWNLDWGATLPWHFDAARVESSSHDEVMAFTREHYAAIFGHASAEGRFLPSPMTEAKRRFLSEMDFFVFRVGRETAGVFMGHPTDWTSYYLRSTAIVPQHRERGLMTRFFERLAEPLRGAGVERIEADCSPANAPIIRVLSGQGYVVTGTTNSERWGLLLRYTKFLRDDARGAFLRQYTAMPIAQRGETETLNTDRSRP